jgi:hypothetical protein
MSFLDQDLDVTPAWVYGGSGHAFVLNVHDVVCPSGPTAWDRRPFWDLCRNLGIETEVVTSGPEDSLDDMRRLAWDKARTAIDQGLPCYGWELDIPEYYLIYGYDETGYYYRGPRAERGAGPLPWERLGESEIGVVEVNVVRPGAIAGDRRTLVDVIDFALEWAESPNQWMSPGYHSGDSGYEIWRKALEGGLADGFGCSYNAQVWAECRYYAWAFLEEARNRCGQHTEEPFAEAVHRYAEVSAALKQVADLFPFLGVTADDIQGFVKDEERVSAAVAALERAQDAEVAGLKALGQIRHELREHNG